MTKAELEAAQARAAITTCANCRDECKRFGEWFDEKTTDDFCGQHCKEAHERASAPLYKPQPKRTKENTYGAYDI